MTGRLVLLLSILALGGARAGDGDLCGAWRVDGGDAFRTVEDAGPSRVAVTIHVGDVGVRCEGAEASEGTTTLEGTLPCSPGLVGALERIEGRTAPIAVRLTITLEPRDEETGEERASVVATRDGRRLFRERWSRPGPPGLQIIDVERGDRLDPTVDRLKVRVRVLGQPQDVELQVRLAERSGPLTRFYEETGVFSRHGRGVIRLQRGGEALAVGTHLLEWDGRDGTAAKRIALEGHYRLVIDSPQRRRDAELGRPVAPAPERPVSVARPLAILSGGGPEGPLDVLRVHYRRHEGGPSTGGELLSDLTRCAAAFIDGPGAPPLDLMQVGLLHEREGTLPGHGRGPLADVHVVHVIVDGVGAPRVHADGHGGAWQETSLPDALIAAGVDVVVALERPVVGAERRAYHEELGPRLLRYGAPLRRALLDARDESHERWWEGRDLPEPMSRLGRAVEAAWARSEGQVPIREAMSIRTGPGIDPYAERLMPARHGCSTN